MSSQKVWRSRWHSQHPCVGLLVRTSCGSSSGGTHRSRFIGDRQRPRGAQHLGARAYLYGELYQAEDGFTIRIDVIDAASNDRLGTVTEHASRREGLLDAITRLSAALRARVGDVSPSDKATLPTPLRAQATSNLAALNLFAEAEGALSKGDQEQAKALYQQALTLAPDFTLAQLRLADLFARDGAEIPASRLAAQALASSSRTGPRIAGLAQISAALLSDEDPVRAAMLARHLLNARPQDQSASSRWRMPCAAGPHD